MTSTPSTFPWVFCLCAQWCGTCRSYESVFKGVQTQFPSARLNWVDVEDLAHVVDPADVLDLENFPTLLVAHPTQATFFGPITPQPETLLRLLQAKLTPNAQAIPDADAQALFERLKVHFS